ncbi:hypothetical protein SLEP1_g25214 [Rubroshorea leprosula]|uniref:Uncharacterized protein n=1 Tax=Rubroshorea leprosula TaxID=152421 RepID=A0AAV5JI01_9ROSI|nr:hypothetical protein SLEP1_g25214 [Rubroshorea leprosula]
MLLSAIINEDFPCCFPFFCFMLAIIVVLGCFNPVLLVIIVPDVPDMH